MLDILIGTRDDRQFDSISLCETFFSILPYPIGGRKLSLCVQFNEYFMICFCVSSHLFRSWCHHFILVWPLLIVYDSFRMFVRIFDNTYVDRLTNKTLNSSNLAQISSNSTIFFYFKFYTQIFSTKMKIYFTSLFPDIPLIYTFNTILLLFRARFRFQPK